MWRSIIEITTANTPLVTMHLLYRTIVHLLHRPTVHLLHRLTHHTLLGVALEPVGQGHKPNGQNTTLLQLDLMTKVGLPQML